MKRRSPFDFSPFKVRVLPGIDPNKVIVTGNGVQPRGVLASMPTSFLVDTRDAGVADLDVMIQVRDHLLNLQCKLLLYHDKYVGMDVSLKLH